MNQTMKTTVNGVDVKALRETMEAITADPEIAQFQFRLKNSWMGGAHNRSTVDAFYGAKQEHRRGEKAFQLDNDEHPVLLGTDIGANPVEYVLHALAGCLTTSMIYHAAAMGIELESVESTLEGDLDLRGLLGLSDEVRNGYQNVRVNFKVKGDAPPEQLAELVEKAKAHSPVFDVVSNPVAVSVTVSNS